MRLRDRELLGTVSAPTDGGESITIFYPARRGSKAGSPAVLTKVQGMFSRIRFNSLRVWWVGTGGTTLGGSVILSWDKAAALGEDASKISRVQVAGLQPNVVLPAWCDGQSKPLVLAGASLQGGVGTGWFSSDAKDFGDCLPALLIVSNSGKGSGDVWIEYDVTLTGLHT